VRELGDHDVMALLDEVERHAPDDGELHRLDVLYRHLGPSATPVIDRLAVLRRAVAPAPAEVRGAAELRLLELSAGGHSVMLELRPRCDQPTFDLHGQLFTSQPIDEEVQVVLSWGGSELRTSRLDTHGEFDFREVPEGTYRVTWHLPGERIVLQEAPALAEESAHDEV